MFYHVFETVNLLNCKRCLSVHATDDIFFGTDDYYDQHAGSQEDLVADISLYGRDKFRVRSLHAFHTFLEAFQHKERLLPQYLHGNTYNKPIHIPDHTIGHRAIRELIQKNGISFDASPEYCANKRTIAIRHNLKQYLGRRSGTIWITNERINLKLDGTMSIPQGFRRGLKHKSRRGGFTRSAENREKISVTMKNRFLQSSQIISVTSVI